MRQLLFVLLAFIVLASCTKDNEGNKDITLTGGTSTSQTVYADETSKTDGIKFSAVAAWTATVSEAVSSKAAVQDDFWLRLSAYNGGAGEQSITMIIDPNTTGADRRAEIRIVCGGTTITVIVEQKATTQSGGTPDISTFISPNGVIKGGEIFGRQIPSQLSWVMVPFDFSEEDEGLGGMDDQTNSPGKFAYQNKNFYITLPTPPSKSLGNFFPDVTVIPSDTKFSQSIIEELGNTNIPWQEYQVYGRGIKVGDGDLLFVYATKAATVNGTFNQKGNSVVFNNCSFRQGWNEVLMVSTKDSPYGTIQDGFAFNVVVNKTPSSYKWVAVAYLETQIINNITESGKTIHSPDSAEGRMEQPYSNSVEFAYDSHTTRLNQLQPKSPAPLNIQYNSGNVTFDSDLGQPQVFTLNSQGYFASWSRSGAGGTVLYDYDGTGLSKVTVKDYRRTIDGISLECKDIISLNGMGSYEMKSYIDFNRDNDFSEVSELIVTESTSIYFTHSVFDREYKLTPDIRTILYGGVQSEALRTIFNIFTLCDLMGGRSALPGAITVNTTIYPYDKNGILTNVKPVFAETEAKYEYTVNANDYITLINVTSDKFNVRENGERIAAISFFEKTINLTYKNSWK